MMRAADATAQLVQLREAEMLGAIDQNRVGARYVDAGLDDRGADQDVEALVIEVEHHLFEFALAHLAVRETHASFRHQLLDLAREVFDVPDLDRKSTRLNSSH